MLPGIERDDDPGFWIPFVQRVAQKVEQRGLADPPRSMNVDEKRSAERKLCVDNGVCGGELACAGVPDPSRDDARETLAVQLVDRRGIVGVRRHGLLGTRGSRGKKVGKRLPDL